MYTSTPYEVKRYESEPVKITGMYVFPKQKGKPQRILGMYSSKKLDNKNKESVSGTGNEERERIARKIFCVYVV